MSRSKCPFPNEFELMYRYSGYDGRLRSYVNEFRPAIAVKNNGWYTIYSNEQPNVYLWQRRCYATSLRWYDLQRLVDSGIVMLDQPEEETTIDISSLI